MNNLISKATMSDDEMNALNNEAKTKYFKSELSFLNSHNGFRRGCFHVALGMPGGGKSTLRNTVILDFAKNNPDKKILLWLSEERVKDFKRDLSHMPEQNKELDNVYIFSEQDNFSKVKDIEKGVELFKELIIKSQCDLFVYDNITTSNIYGASFSDQNNFISMLKNSLQNLSTSSFILAHTSSAIKQDHRSLIDMNDVRGTKDLTNYTEFLYVLQSFYVKEKTFTTLRTLKFRGQDCDNKMFALHYSKEKRIYDFDGSIDFEVFNGIFSKRNRLGQKKNN